MLLSRKPPGPVLSAFLGLLVVGACFCGVHAILADSVTTPARFGSSARVYGTDTLFVGAGWLAAGMAILTSLITAHVRSRAGQWIALGFCGVAAVCWFAVVL